MNEEQYVEKNDIIYAISINKKEARVIGCHSNGSNIIIPRSIIFKSTEFVIKNIATKAFKASQIKSISFPNDSELQSIDEYAFIKSSIEYINIPSSLTELKDGWCKETSKLFKVIISPNNPRYSCLNNEMIIGRSSKDTEIYDEVVFCTRNIEEITIPAFIRCIKPYAFEKCSKLHNVEILPNSELQSIEKYAFSESSIERFSIPLHLTRINNNSFFKCKQLQEIEIPINSELQSIGKYAFAESSIKCFSIPSQLKEINDSAFYKCKKLHNVEISEFSELQSIGKYAFSESSIEYFSIPLHLKELSDGLFFKCSQLRRIGIPDNSELQIINSNVFEESLIESIEIPPKLIELKDGWCKGTDKLTEIFVSAHNPKYLTYGNEMIIGRSSKDTEIYDEVVFCTRNIEEITIPAFIRCIKPYAFEKCSKLHNVEILPNSELQSIEKYAFSESSIERFSIPLHLTRINNNSFFKCKQLQEIEIPINSELQSIGKYAFAESSIQSFYIPQKTIKINKYAFYKCKQLCKVEISENSELQSIGKYAFSESSIDCFSIPLHLTKINESAFYKCKQLYKVEIPTKSELRIIKKSAFSESSIESFIITSHLSEISDNAFYKCKQLRKVETQPNSELRVISNYAFAETSIESFTIPPHLTELSESTFNFCNKLQIIEVDNKFDIKNIGPKLFQNCGQVTILNKHLTDDITDDFIKTYDFEVTSEDEFFEDDDIYDEDYDFIGNEYDESEYSDEDGEIIDEDDNIHTPLILDSKQSLELFHKEYQKFFNANFLTQKAKILIYNFINQPKYSNISIEKKCEIINISRKTLYNYTQKDMSIISQNKRNKSKGKKSKLTHEELNLFFQKCREMRDLKIAISSRWAQNTIKLITQENGHEWIPCLATITYIFHHNGWHRRKSQKRSPMSDPEDKFQKIEKFKSDLKDLITKNDLKRKNVHIMDETGLYSDSIPQYTWTFDDDKEAYVVSSGKQRRDTLVATIRADGEGFATFIEHKNMKIKSVDGQKIIQDKGTKGMNLVEMHKWNKEFLKWAEKGDILIMDNLSSHKNKEVIKELEDNGIIVLFLPPRCADVLSVLDNCFFAVYKRRWYTDLIFVDNVKQKREKAIKLFNKMISEDIGKKMYHHCGYDEFFNEPVVLEPIETVITRNSE